MRKSVVFLCAMFLLLPTVFAFAASAKSELIFINQNNKYSIKVYYKVCHMYGDVVCKDLGVTDLIAANSEVEVPLSIELGSSDQVFASKAELIYDGARFEKTFKTNSSGLNACQSYGDDALLFNVLDDKLLNLTCVRSAVTQ